MRKQYPQYTSEQIRDALPPLPATEAKPPAAKASTTRQRGAKAEPTEKTATGKGKQSAPAGKATSAANGTDREKLAVARKVVTMRDRQGPSWLRIGAQHKLAEGAASPKAGASRARLLYKLVKGQDASTGPLPK